MQELQKLRVYSAYLSLIADVNTKNRESAHRLFGIHQTPRKTHVVQLKFALTTLLAIFLHRLYLELSCATHLTTLFLTLDTHMAVETYLHLKEPI